MNKKSSKVCKFADCERKKICRFPHTVKNLKMMRLKNFQQLVFLQKRNGVEVEQAYAWARKPGPKSKALNTQGVSLTAPRAFATQKLTVDFGSNS